MKRLKPKGDKLDKYRAHLFEGAPLQPDELELLARYRKAHALLCIGYSKNQVLSALEKEYDALSTSHLYAIIRESVELMGSIEEVDRKGERVISIENYKLLANLARKNGDIKAAISAQEKADKLMGLFDAEQGGLDPQAFLKPVAMLFTTDVEQLKRQELPEQTEDTEDIDYEDA
jgi:hypothetical protein